MFSARIVVPIGKQIIRSYSQTASRRRHSYVPLYAIAFAAGLGLSYKYSAQEIVDQFITTPLPTTPQETEKYQQELEKKLKQVPVVAELSKDPKYVATRAWNQLDTVKDGIHQRLNTPGSIAIAPITFHNQESGESVSVIHLGKKLCGYPFLVHGGIISLVIDETLKKHCMLQNGLTDPAKVHTKNLTLNYKFPTLVDSFVVIKSKVGLVENGEVGVKGVMLAANGKRTLVKASAKFVPARTKWFFGLF
ncbi:hypothetical protein OGATHE_000250 [Ogataea polymorpha]|uniref:Thioesterase domain-containing protein n=1 Tax=Ogataea polymorpha TaxID=460523 RepID=A0A9P8PW44_9ASCO|nr:hypothetical protein OGATHE_000250 [Ogataea polymorpha]